MINNDAVTLLVSTKDAAQMCGVCQTTFRKTMRNHGIQPVKLFGDSRWPVDEIVKLISGDRSNPPTTALTQSVDQDNPRDCKPPARRRTLCAQADAQ